MTRPSARAAAAHAAVRARALPAARPATTVVLEREPDLDLVETYLTDLAIAGGDRTAVGPAGRRALAQLMESATAAIEAMVAGHLRDRFRTMVPDGLQDECVAHGLIAAMESVTAYDGSAPFAKWMTAKRGGPARDAMRRAVARWTGTDDLTEAAQDLLPRLSTMLDQLTIELRRAPSVVELQDALTRQMVAYRTSKLTEREMEMNEAARYALVMAKATRKGELAAIRDVENLLQYVRRTTVSVDGFDNGWDAIAATADDTLGAAPDSELELGALGRVGLGPLTGSDRDAVLSALSGQVGDDVAHLMGDVVARMASPAAHFAYLSPTLALQFEDAPISRVQAAAAAARHR